MIGVLLLLVAFLTAILGYFNSHYDLPLPKPIEYFIADFYANLSVEFISIAITILIIDQLNERSRAKQLKEQLISQMAGADNAIARNAVAELRIHGWLQDGSLRNLSFYQANLQEAPIFAADLEKAGFSRGDLRSARLNWANLRHADLRVANIENGVLIGADLFRADIERANLGGAYLIEANLQEADLQGATLTSACLWGANLRGAVVTEEQLSTVIMMRDAVMPDGSTYDGRFRLKGDIALANETREVDDPLNTHVELPEYVHDNNDHARQLLRWKWVSENLLDN